MRIIKEGFLYQLTFMPRVFPVNCYFIEEEEGLTLIDAALPNSAKPIIHAAEQIGKPINRIVLTHAHSDHIGALVELKKKLDVPVYLSVRDSRLLAGDTSLDPSEPQTPIRGGVPKNIKIKPDVVLTEGDEIGSLVAFETPGHTPGSMAFLDKRTHSLITGDAFQTRGETAVSGVIVPWFPFPAMATWNRKLALQSAKKILGIKPTILAVGHGELLREPVTHIEKAIRKADAILQKNGA
ncbi:MBL fold metallo-hydrolase [Mesobacillus stamsii]|uniref:Glyoxylase-like metal-dependent hydrolase (Beta-lactamase superfamily II) n=1 Tax=Mesobacillus stamsii TaxID=225347 RepID=A0ABU0FXE3_9BACI|nr:MBL fold metallo-hydrolase [Mesobacillus stamsii]MDQ0413982.1 glyoxylase-like metal-dependent hydrolase (beta-lactamase superfamily II) [Mesobacillus stamsii]